MQRKKIYICSLLILFFILVNPTYAHKTLILGVHPYLPSDELERRFVPLANYLTNEIGVSVVVRIGRNYGEHLSNIGKNKIDIAYLGPATYLNLIEKYGKKPLLAIIETNGSITFKSIIIARTDNSVKAISQLNLQEFAFVNPSSTAGYLVPFQMFLKKQLKLDQYKDLNFLGSHINVALGVLMGDFTAGAVKEEVFHSFKKRGLKSLAMSYPIPEHLFVASTNVSEILIPKLQNALYKLRNSSKGKKIMSLIKKNMTGMLPVKNEFYDELRKKLNRIKN